MAAALAAYLRQVLVTCSQLFTLDLAAAAHAPRRPEVLTVARAQRWDPAKALRAVLAGQRRGLEQPAPLDSTS